MLLQGLTVVIDDKAVRHLPCQQVFKVFQEIVLEFFATGLSSGDGVQLAVHGAKVCIILTDLFKEGLAQAAAAKYLLEIVAYLVLIALKLRLYGKRGLVLINLV